MTTVVVMAKECRPGRVKTRLHPPFSLERAALIAEASLQDTITTVTDLAVDGRVLCLDGLAAPPLPAGWELVLQGSGGLDERIAAALDACDGPTLVIGMDTPQLTAADLPSLTGWPDGVDAWLGPATDGGFWALALREPRGDVVRGVPMSRADTGARQRESLEAAGLRVGMLAPMTDIDDAASLRAVQPRLGDGHLSRLLRSMS
ncbi:TIGR04282 family arsenosugar biosynthesis glycosyltransferase [Microbacterium cremeum]|uniref:TIGR04282 family arsenosugar biosynthesis glycosyltransferase n=1 Tax=Microbacterium cremeum TaxID=2782169 RepID=UPI001E4A68E1|nr:DUF2064 domain-containing protein [Microbacterium cremeum]